MSELAPPLQQIDRIYVLFKGRKLSYFAGCDYFRLSSHPEVIAAVKGGMDRFGLNTAASRKTTGNHEVYHRLERAVAQFFGSERAVIFSTGYVTNLAVAQSVEGRFTDVLIDQRAHLSLQDAAACFGGKIIRFAHRNVDDVAKRVKTISKTGKTILLSDGLFAADGTVAPLQRYRETLPRNAWLLIDDAHGGGVLGSKGRGALELEGIGRERVIQTITLSKAFGVFGGAVVGSRDTCDEIIERSRIFTGNTPLPLPLATGALKAIEILRSDRSYRARLARNTRTVKDGLKEAGIPVVDSPAPIVSIVPKNPEMIAQLKRQLLKAEIFPSFIKYPGGAEGGHFRFVISSEHSSGQLGRLVEVLARYAK